MTRLNLKRVYPHESMVKRKSLLVCAQGPTYHITTTATSLTKTGNPGQCAKGKKGRFLYSAVSSPLDRSVRFIWNYAITHIYKVSYSCLYVVIQFTSCNYTSRACMNTCTLYSRPTACVPPRQLKCSARGAPAVDIEEDLCDVPTEQSIIQSLWSLCKLLQCTSMAD